MSAVDADLAVAIALGTFDRRETAAAGLHGLVVRFRNGDPHAADVAWRAAIELLGREPQLCSPSITAVAVPAHDGKAGPALVALVARLAAEAGWSMPETDALVRVSAVPEAKRRTPRDPAADLASLRWCGDAVPVEARSVILFDDVLASGATLDACRAALRRDGWRGGVRAIVLARST